MTAFLSWQAVTLAVLAGGLLSTGWRYHRWYAQEHRQIREYRLRLRGRLARAEEDARYRMWLDVAKLGLTVDRLQDEVLDQLDPRAPLHIVRSYQGDRRGEEAAV